MSSSSLSFIGMTGLGVQPYSSAASLAMGAALQTTSQLASSTGGSGAILAAGVAGAPSAAPAGTSTAAQTDALNTLRRRMNTACYVDKDARACSMYSQQLAELDVQQRCGYNKGIAGAAIQEDHFAKWFLYPAWVSPVNPTTTETASVALALTASNPITSRF